MEILKGYRGCGKTKLSIKNAFYNNATIVVGNNQMERIIKKRSKEMQMPVKVISFDRYIKANPGKKREKIIIDQLEHIIHECFKYDDVMFATTDLEVLTDTEWKKDNITEKKEMTIKPEIVYLCDRRNCDNCSGLECKHTSNIKHAKNFENVNGVMQEIEK